VPARGEWQPVPGIGWQHGPIPPAPPRLVKAAQEAWRVWFGAWYASHWSPDNLPDLRTCIRLLDQVERGQFQRANELRMWEDNLGISLKGQQALRWAPPKADEKPVTSPTVTPTGRYDHLRALPSAEEAS
jgi:hypothetical protein